MSIKDKDQLLADYLEGTISEEALIGLYPELKAELKAIKRAQSALNEFSEIIPERNVKIEFDPAKTKWTIKPLWRIAATVALVIGLVIILRYWGLKEKSLITIDLATASTEEKLYTIVEILKSEKTTPKDSQGLFDLAVNDQNSNIRYIALQKLVEQPPIIDKNTLSQHLENEHILNNQIAWIELWVTLYKNDSEALEKWLNHKDRHPTVKDYGEKIIRGL